MTTFTHQLLSIKKINARSRIMRVRIFQPQCCVSVAVLGYAEVIFIQPGGKYRHHVTWCLAKTSYPTSRWDVAIANDHSSSMALPLTPPETQELAAWESSAHWANHFVHRIARIWTRLTCHLGCSSAYGLPSSKHALRALNILWSNFLLSWQNEESVCQKHDRNYHTAQSLPIHHFYHFLPRDAL